MTNCSACNPRKPQPVSRVRPSARLPDGARVTNGIAYRRLQGKWEWVPRQVHAPAVGIL